MRTLWLSLVGTLILLMLGGAVVVGQDDESLDPMRASRFTGTFGELLSGAGPDEMEWITGPGYGESLGNETVIVFEASDPRISGTWTQVNDLRAFPIDLATGDNAVAWTAAVRVENPDGAWTGTVDGFHNGTASIEWNRLVGEGAYEGLTAMFLWTEEDDFVEGVIIPGVPPEYPAPIGTSQLEEPTE